MIEKRFIILKLRILRIRMNKTKIFRNYKPCGNADYFEK